MKRALIYTLLTVLILSACAPTSTLAPAPTIATPWPTMATATSLVIVGATIPTEALTIVRKRLEAKTFDGLVIATSVDAGTRGWQIITDEKGQVEVFVNRDAGAIFLAQGPPDFRWDSENWLWYKERPDGKKLVLFPHNLLSGGWHEDTQTAGPWAWTDEVFWVRDKHGKYLAVFHYPASVVQELLGYDALPSNGNGLCSVAMERLQLAQSLIVLPDGSGLCWREIPNLILEPGQHIESYCAPDGYCW